MCENTDCEVYIFTFLLGNTPGGGGDMCVCALTHTNAQTIYGMMECPFSTSLLEEWGNVTLYSCKCWNSY